MPDMIVASVTAEQNEVDHAVSADWRSPLPVKEPEKPATEAQTEEKTETPATSEETQEVETVPDSEPEETQEKPSKGKGGFQKRIDKLTKEKGELAEKLSAYEERFKVIEERLAKPAATEPEKPVKTSPETPGKPLDSEIGTKYKDWNEYNEALIDWKADQRLAAKLAERDQTAEQREVQEIQQAREEGYRESAKQFAESVPDFNEAITAATKAGMKLPQPILERIQEMSNGPQIAYYLVKNPDEALALVEASPADGFIMLGRISYGLEHDAEPAPKPPAKKVVSTAPPAVKPVAGHSARSSSSLQEISKASTDEYIRVRQAQIREKEARRYS